MRVEADGRWVETTEGASAASLLDRADQTGPDRVVAAVIDGELVDLSHPLTEGARLAWVRQGTPEGRSVLRHSAAHVLAKAVTTLFPGTAYATGPATDEGFYYDFLPAEGHRFTEEDLARIEQEMVRLIGEDEPFVREEVSLEEARRRLRDQPFKLEILDRIEGGQAGEVDAQEVAAPGRVSLYRTGAGFVDLCRGPHVPSTRAIGCVRLLAVSGAYWRGDEHAVQLQRIVGTAFATLAELDAYLELRSEAERRDHRRLGLELDWFHFPGEIGSGLPIFHPKGAFIRYRMEDFSRRAHLASGYQLAWTPHLAKAALYERSGHLEWYSEGMYPPMVLDEQDRYYLKPMNCPMHMLIYKAQPRSYRDLPLRLFEFGTVYRYERSGTVHGLLRARGFTQDDAHIFCAPSQLQEELGRLIRFVLAVLGAFGLEHFDAELSTRPEHSVGSDEEWEFATAALHQALAASGLPYRVAEGEGAFYAPKIDIHLTDAIGRRWQLSTLQVDLQEPGRFDLEYQSATNAKERPYMIHRALFGSVERFFAILTEHYGGALPGWLLPEQVRILPITERASAYATELLEELGRRGLRSALEDASEPLGARIRRARLARVPFIVVVGDRDLAAGTLGVTERDTGTERRGVPREEFLAEARLALAEPQLEVS